MAPFGDVAPALDVCRAAARGAPPDVVRTLALDALLRLVTADGALWVEVAPAASVGVMTRPGPTDGVAVAAYAAHLAGPCSSRTDGPVLHDLPGDDLVCLALPPAGGRRAGMALHRAAPLTLAERDRLEAVAPLVVCALLAAGRAPVAEDGLLTSREEAVLRSVATGMSDKQAERVLGVSPRTIGKHLEHIYAKLGVAGRTEAAAHLWLQG